MSVWQIDLGIANTMNLLGKHGIGQCGIDSGLPYISNWALQQNQNFPFLFFVKSQNIGIPQNNRPVLFIDKFGDYGS